MMEKVGKQDPYQLQTHPAATCCFSFWIFTSLTVFWLRARIISADAPRTNARFILNREKSMLRFRFLTKILLKYWMITSELKQKGNVEHVKTKRLTELYKNHSLYWPQHQQRTPGSQSRLCFRLSPRAQPRSTALAFWCQPCLFLHPPVSPHL